MESTFYKNGNSLSVFVCLTNARSSIASYPIFTHYLNNKQIPTDELKINAITEVKDLELNQFWNRKVSESEIVRIGNCQNFQIL